jgi:hypothetical protein
MDMFRHDYKSEKQKSSLDSNLIKIFHEDIASAWRNEKRLTPITTEGEEVQIPLAVVPFEWVMHQSQNPHP